MKRHQPFRRLSSGSVTQETMLGCRWRLCGFPFPGQQMTKS